MIRKVIRPYIIKQYKKNIKNLCACVCVSSCLQNNINFVVVVVVVTGGMKMAHSQREAFHSPRQAMPLPPGLCDRLA